MTSYTEGGWLALVTPGSVAMLADAPAEALPTLARALDERGLAGFIDALTEATGTTASSLPGFAVAIAEEQGVRVAVRGASTLTDTSGESPVSLTGVNVTGWAEVVWPATAVLDVASPEPAGREELWIVEGAVRAASVRWVPANPREVPLRDAAPSSEVPASTAVQRPTREDAPLAVPEPAPEPEAEAEEISLETLAPAYETVAGSREQPVDDDGFGPLWGSTIATAPSDEPKLSVITTGLPDFTSPPPPLVPTASAPPAPPASVAPVPLPEPAEASCGDHDGATMSIAALRAMTGGPPSSTAAAPVTPSFASSEQLAKEQRGRAVFSTGTVVTLDKNVIVGRAPKASRVTGDMPHLVTVPSPSQDISRSHVELRMEGAAVVAVDLNTTNGTLVRRQGAEPVRLHPGEPHVLLNGDVLDLGDNVTVTMEDLK